MLTEKQLQQVNKNLCHSQTKATITGLSSPMTEILTKTTDPMCECGKPRIKFYSHWLKRDVFAKFCVDCEHESETQNVINELNEEKAVIARAIKRELDPLYYKASLDDFNQQLIDGLNEKPEDQGLLIWGKVGTGKSHLASALIKQALMSGQRAKMVRFKDVILRVRASYDENHTEESVLRPYINCQLLSIEDIGTIKSGRIESDFCQDTLLTIIDARVSRKLPTIITTNLSPETILQSFGSRLASRFSTFLTFKLEGRDRRLDHE